ncbi:MAG: carboxypeptidase-like regulatory domain-containing protein [Saprospiraceae bacterium]
MKASILSLFFFLGFSIFSTLQAQIAPAADSTLVQFSGMVLDGTTEDLYPVPYTNILVQGQGRGTYSDFKGFFSIVVEKGDVIVFSAVGYETVEYTIPDELEDNRYSLVQLMTQDAYNLPETVVFPWPSREHFKLEFLAMDVTPELQERAARNIANESLRRMRNKVDSDANEQADYYLRQQAREFYYIGQRPPMNIFNPVAWKKFFDAWKAGDYKKKDEDLENGY